eukprot:2059146-Lingulodinium_polyedra.AAC.1
MAEKWCKWCGRSNRIVAWARGGDGLECKADNGYIKYHYPTAKQKKELLDKINSDPHGQREHRQNIEEHETGTANGERLAKRHWLSAEDSTEVEGREALGNFWPELVYKQHFNNNISRAEMTMWDGRKGIMLPRKVPIVEGVV